MIIPSLGRTISEYFGPSVDKGDPIRLFLHANKPNSILLSVVPLQGDLGLELILPASNHAGAILRQSHLKPERITQDPHHLVREDDLHSHGRLHLVAILRAWHLQSACPS